MFRFDTFHRVVGFNSLDSKTLNYWSDRIELQKQIRENFLRSVNTGRTGVKETITVEKPK